MLLILGLGGSNVVSYRFILFCFQYNYYDLFNNFVIFMFFLNIFYNFFSFIFVLILIDFGGKMGILRTVCLKFGQTCLLRFLLFGNMNLV